MGAMTTSISIILLVLAVSAWQSFACDASFVLPSVSYQWRSKHTAKHYSRIKFSTEYPLSVDMIKKGMPVLSLQELHRFLPLVTLLSQQQLDNGNRSVTIASLGGSFALGTQCCLGSSWPHRFVEWLRKAYPRVHINHVEYLKGSTNSLYGAALVRQLFETEKVDLLLMGYALNDEVRLSACIYIILYYDTRGFVSDARLR